MINNSTRVPTALIRSDVRHPTLFEKKNIMLCGLTEGHELTCECRLPAAAAFPIVAVQPAVVQIFGIEAAGGLQRPHVGDGEPLAFEDDQALAAQVLQRPIDVNGGQPGSVGDIELGRRKIAGKAVRQADRFEPQKHLAEEVRDAFMRAALADVDDPLAMDRFAATFSTVQAGGCLPIGFFLAQPLASLGFVSKCRPGGFGALAALADMRERRGLPLDPGLLGPGEKEVEVRVPENRTGHAYSADWSVAEASSSLPPSAAFRLTAAILPRRSSSRS